MEGQNAILDAHEETRCLMKMLTATSGNSETRKHLFLSLKKQLIRNTKQQINTNCLASLNGQRTDFFAYGLGDRERNEIDQFVEELERIDMGSPRWLLKFKVMQNKVLLYLKSRECLLFDIETGN